MNHACKMAAATFALFLLLAPAAQAAPRPGPIESILSAPFELGGRLVSFAAGIPDSLAGGPRRARHQPRARMRHARRAAKRHDAAYRYKEPM